MENIIWHPTEHAWTEHSHIANFMRDQGFEIDQFPALHKKSITDLEWFWNAAIDDMGLEWSTPYSKVIDRSSGFPYTKWFTNGQINITHNCIDRHVLNGHGNDTALIHEPDSGCQDARHVSYTELKNLVDQCAGALKHTGIKEGESVGLYAPMSVETVAVMFACFKLGLRFVPIFCGFGEHAIIDRLESCGARILFANKKLQRRGKSIHTSDTVEKALNHLPNLKQTIYLDTQEWQKFITQSTPLTESNNHTEAETPCMVIYTSGTTGKPKGTIHTHAGVLATVGKELRYAFDVHPGEPFFWVTDIGWMMGPWELIGCLLYRAPVVMLNGAPNHPHPDRIWEIVEKNKVITLGISPTAIRLCMSQKESKGPKAYDVSNLKIMGSTGEAWDSDSYQWAFEQIGKTNVPIMNISGGTEIMGCHLQPYPVMPIKPLTLGMGALGMDVQVFNEDGLSVKEEVGHLVCCQPAPSMTKSFLGDNQRYLDTYFQKFGNQIWYHGDWASIDSDGYWFLHGRTDDTIKVAGKRIGPAEVENALISHPAVSQAAVIGIPDPIKGQTLVCFTVCTSNIDEETLRNYVADRMGKPLKPKHVYIIPELPKTRSGKIVRSTIQKIYLGENPGDLSSIENPDSLTNIQKLTNQT